MRVRWTTDAADDLERICDYIAESRPESARRVAESIGNAIFDASRVRVREVPFTPEHVKAALGSCT